MDRYDNDYKEQNETWHIEDAPWKVEQILKILDGKNLTFDTIAEVGCGSGEILSLLSKKLPEVSKLTGYDISSDLGDMWKQRESEKLTFIKGDFLQTDKHYDMLLFMDVVEHVEDYIGFLRTAKDKGEYKIFNFPLELFALKAITSGRYKESRRKYGHLHYFNKEICISVLESLGYEIIDSFYGAGAIELSNTTTSISPLSRALKYPRLFLSKINEELSVKLLGGSSLFIIAK